MGSQTPRCTVERRRGQAAEAPDEAEAAKAEKEAEEEAEEEEDEVTAAGVRVLGPLPGVKRPLRMVSGGCSLFW